MLKALIVLLKIMLVLLVIVVGAFFWVDKNQGRIAGDLIKEKFTASEWSKVYKLKFDALDLRILSGKIIIRNFSLVPDTLFYQAADTLRLKYPILIEAVVPLLSLSGLDVLDLMMNRNLKIGGVEIFNPGIHLIDHLTKEEKLLRGKNYAPQPDTSVRKPIPIHHFNLEYFKITGGTAGVFNRVMAKSIFRADSIQLLLSDVQIDPEKPLQTILEKKYGSSWFEVGAVYFKNEKGFYDFNIGGIVLNLAENSLEIANLQLTPKYDKSKFGHKYGKQTDRFDVKAGSIKMRGFDINRYLLSGGIALQAVKVNGMELEIHRDKNVPADLTRFPKLPWQMLAQVKNYIAIDTIEVRNSTIRYEELAPEQPEAGKVPLSDVNISVYNVSNDSAYIAQHGAMMVQISANVFNQGDLLLNIDVPDDLTSGDFSFNGRIGQMDMKAFNSMTELNALVNIENGTLDSLVFWANANENYASGQLIMVYDNLKFNVLKKDNEKRNLSEMGLLSWLANRVVKSFNPSRNKPNEKPKIAEIFVERDKNKSVFNYIVKSVISGLKGSLVPGIGKTLKKYEKQKLKEQKRKLRKRNEKSKK